MSIDISAAPTGPSRKTPDVVVNGDPRGFLQEIASGPHRFQADEPLSVGGTESAPDPYDYLLAGLGACTSMTIGYHARRKQWPLEAVKVSLWHDRIHATDCAECETKNGMLDRIEVEIALSGPLNDQQRATLLEAAHRCPVHRTLQSEIVIEVRAVPGGG
ncbi:MAG: OsmC family protein [Chthoniobacterales bacterium]